MELVDGALASRLEEAEAAHWRSLLAGLAAMPGNPYGAEVKRFGGATALVCPGMPTRSFVNRVLWATQPDEIDAALKYFRSKKVSCRIDLTPFQATDKLLAHLARRGCQQTGFQVALYRDITHITMPDFDIRLADTPDARQFAVDALPVAFGEQDAAQAKWLADSMEATLNRQDWRTYVAYVDGIPAAFGQLHVSGATGCLALAGTLPDYREHGAQTALIHRRVAGAVLAGCDLVCTQTGNGTVSQHNMERADFRIAYTKAEFSFKPGA